MKRILSLFAAVAIVFAAMAQNRVTLKMIDFSTWNDMTICAESNSADETIDGITFHSANSSAKPFTIESGVMTWCNNNFGDKYFITFPLEGINGHIYISVWNGESNTRFTYGFGAEETTYRTSGISKTSSASGNPSVVEIETEATFGYLYLGRQGSGYTQCTKILVETDAPLAPTIESLTLAGVEATIDQENHTITAELPYGTDIMTVLMSGDFNYVLGGSATGATPDMANRTITVTDGTTEVVYTMHITVSAVQKHTVTFYNGINETHIQVVDGELVTAPEDPVQDLAAFIGWFADEACTVAADLTQPITADITFYAKWELVYAVTADFLTEAQAEAPTAIKTFLDTHNIAYSADIDDKGGWDTNDDVNNDKYYGGYKIKNNNAYIAFRVHANEPVKVVFGYAEISATIYLNDVAQDFTIDKLGVKEYEITPEEETVVKIVNNAANGKTLVIRKIEIGEDNEQGGEEGGEEGGEQGGEEGGGEEGGEQGGEEGGGEEGGEEPSTGLLTICANGVYYANGVIYNPQGVQVMVYNADGQLVANACQDIDLRAERTNLFIVRTDKGVLKVVK